ncbi:hypothetical protein SAMN06265222_105156 [Neorhodopirellula lusitana]|uniref:Uncharacterized protein n=1 Tax=Neorhodopirellula lusitana TaxID=445327 RepID=A0ABY1Q4T1_9BACT|nr:hypothetical protein SAMN06265222_105156 [Neorhodopirellula lusitana]
MLWGIGRSARPVKRCRETVRLYVFAKFCWIALYGYDETKRDCGLFRPQNPH